VTDFKTSNERSIQFTSLSFPFVRSEPEDLLDMLVLSRNNCLYVATEGLAMPNGINVKLQCLRDSLKLDYNEAKSVQVLDGQRQRFG